MAAGDLFKFRLADGSIVTLTATVDGIPYRLSDGTLVYIKVNP